jgi:hypothetical protein
MRIQYPQRYQERKKFLAGLEVPADVGRHELETHLVRVLHLGKWNVF